MKKEKNYFVLSWKVFGISLLVMLLFMVLSIIFDINPDTVTFEIFRIFILGSYGVAVISILYFFVSVIYTQFKDNQILWGVISAISLIAFIVNRGEDSSDISLLIVLVSCLWYYFSHIKPKFAIKKKK